MKEESGWGIPRANVVVRTSSDSSLVAFTPTNVRGEFTLKLPEGTYNFRVSSVGFKTQNRRLTVTRRTARTAELDFTLSEDEQVLEEVVIQERRLPIVEREDTLEFDAAYFAGAGDRKAIDILRKVPGIDVRQDGSIYYKGKRIKDILIDGESLFDQSPETLARAFPADALDKIQVLENYTAFGDRQNPFGEEKALNFTIREDKKNVLFGQAALAGGRGESGRAHYRAEGNAFWLRKKVKTLWLGDFNNTGAHVFDLRSYARFVGYDNLGNIAQAPIGRTPSELPPAIQTEFGALSLVLRPTETFRFQANGFLNRQQTLERTRLERQYFSEDLPGVYQQNQEQRNTNLLGAGKIMATFVPNPKHSLTFQLRLSPRSNQYESQQQTDFVAVQNQSQMEGSTNRFLTELQSTHLLTFNKHNTLDTDLTLRYQPRRETLFLSSEDALFPTLLPEDAQNDVLQQQTEDRIEVKWHTTFRHQFTEKLSLETSAGTAYQREEHNFDAEKLPADPFDRAGRYELQKYYASSLLKWKKTIFTLEAGLRLANYDWNIAQPNASRRQNHWRAEPKLSLRFNLARSQQLQLSYERANELPPYNQFLESIQIQDFRLAQRGSANLSLFYTDSYQLRYFLNYLFSEVMVFARLGYTRTPQGVNTSQVIEGATELSTPLQSHQETTFFTLTASKGFRGKIPLFLRFSANIFQFHAINIINNERQAIQNLTQNYKLSAQTRFKQSFNTTLELNAKLLGSRQTGSQLYTLVNTFFWQPFSFLRANVRLEQVRLVRENNRQHFFLLGGELSADISPSTSLALKIHNLNNMNALNTIQLNPIFEQQRREELLSRFFLLKLTHQF